MFKTTIPALGLVLLSGCSMAPDYQRPAAPVAESYSGAQTTTSNSSQHVPDWQQFYQEPELQALIELALVNNRDLRINELSTEQLRAYFRIQRSALLPNLDAAGNGTRQRSPADLTYTGDSSISSSYQVGLQMPAYELDFFGRVQSLRDEALQQYLASETAQASVELSLITSVANQYHTLLALREQRALASEGKAAARKAYKINKDSFDGGVGTELDLRTAEAQLEAYRASEIAFQEQVRQAENRLGELLGTTIPTSVKASDATLANSNMSTDLPVGLPSELLVRRPDIRAAEHVLQAANAKIGAARATFFPSVKLTAFGGTASSELSGLFESGSAAWSFAPQITLPIFAGGRNKANLQVAELQKQIEIANYEKSIQTAFREVADALAVRSTIDQRIEAQAARVEAARRRNELSDQRFEAGIDSFLPVLLAQQELFAAKQDLVRAQLDRLTSQTALFAALGGGWEE
ncbi:efflux transporter outer membrane subunit [Coraliomargarita sp. SDUM461004]|uniref:Efflux transporter outer membrane subunit n=1 Tax=Thalassobacterium sedimentorum TaxID=3041258 RepID=A0ABU1AEJ2_9BACT|nr:efflux transporter outer membrane subunit [Coraliomargarita sp. SDUM461004]MDQ8193064.1 efflux transporter outer membrane subunit [Coraliomargarita sp. SDUM461004]